MLQPHPQRGWSIPHHLADTSKTSPELRGCQTRSNEKDTRKLPEKWHNKFPPPSPEQREFASAELNQTDEQSFAFSLMKTFWTVVPSVSNTYDHAGVAFMGTTRLEPF
jgi:hypothetical protein